VVVVGAARGIKSLKGGVVGEGVGEVLHKRKKQGRLELSNR
jgi:hypothetical protein